MKRIPRLSGRKGIVAAVGALTVAAAGGTAYAATGPSSVGTPSLAGPRTQPGVERGRARPLLRRADHATMELKVKGQWVTYTLDKGKVTAVSPTSITLSRPDGQSVTETLTSNTRYRGVDSESQIRTGSPAVVLSEGGTALRVGQPAGGEAAPAGTAPAA